MTQRAAVLSAVCAAVALGCGGGDSGGGDASAGSVKDAAQQTVDALWGDDPGSACGHFTDSYKAQVVKEAKASGGFSIEGDSCEQVMAAAVALAKGFGATKAEVGKVTVEGDRARVVFENGEQGRSINLFVREGDEWLLDEEHDLGDPAGSDEPTADEVKKWPDKWCRVEPGMTKSQVVEIMGEPTEEFEGTNPQVSYDAFEYGFTAFFGVDGTVRQLDINTADLSDEQIAALPCEETRRR